MAKTKRSTPQSRPEQTQDAEASISLALDKAEAAAWILDQVKVGELGFLHGKDAYVPCWISKVGQKPEELKASLEHWAIESISDAVREIRKCMEILNPAEPSKPKGGA